MHFYAGTKVTWNPPTRLTLVEKTRRGFNRSSLRWISELLLGYFPYFDLEFWTIYSVAYVSRYREKDQVDVPVAIYIFTWHHMFIKLSNLQIENYKLETSYANNSTCKVEICTGQILTARSIDFNARSVTARGPELSLGASPFRPVACPSPARDLARQKQFPEDFLQNLVRSNQLNVSHFVIQRQLLPSHMPGNTMQPILRRSIWAPWIVEVINFA